MNTKEAVQNIIRFGQDVPKLNFTSLYDIFNQNIVLDQNQQGNRNSALADFMKDYNQFESKLAGHSDQAKNYFRDIVLKQLQSATFPSPVESVNTLIGSFVKSYPTILKNAFDKVATELMINIPPPDATKLLGGGGAGDAKSWTLAEWGNTLRYLRNRAYNQYKTIEDKALSLDEQDPKRNKFVALMNIKAQYAAAVDRLLQQLQELQKGVGGKEILPTDKIPDSMLSGAGRGSIGFGQGGVGGIGGVGIGGRGGLGEGASGASITILKTQPFLTRGRDENYLYIKDLLKVFGMAGMYANLDKGPDFLRKAFWASGQWDVASKNLKGFDINPQAYLYELITAMKAIYQAYSSQGTPNTKQFEEYDRLMSGIVGLTKFVQPPVAAPAAATTTAPADEARKAQIAGDAAKWRQSYSDGTLYKYMVDEKDYRWNGDKNYFIKYFDKNNGQFVNANGQVFRFTRNLEAKPGQEPFNVMLVGNFYDPGVRV